MNKINTRPKSLDVIRAKPKLIFHIVGGLEFIIHPCVYSSKGAIFVRFDFGIAQIPCTWTTREIMVFSTVF